MKYNPMIHNRRSIRMKGYDYSKAGLYFITFCVQNRELLFGTIENGEMILNDAGKMIEIEWEKLPQRFKNIEMHKFTVMPNHFHGIVEIVTPVGAPLVGAQNTGPENTGPENTGPENTGPENTGVPAQNNGNTSDPIVGAPLVGAQYTGAFEAKDADPVHGDNRAPIHERAPTRGAPTEGSAAQTVGEMMGAFKSITTVEYINGVNSLGWEPFDGKLWQRNFYEHIIRDERSYYEISDYIVDNPARWKEDKFYRGW